MAEHTAPTYFTPSGVPVYITEEMAYEMARGLAERGEDYGWSVYHRGMPPKNFVGEDGDGAAWADAFRFACTTFRAVAGRKWSF